MKTTAAACALVIVGLSAWYTLFRGTDRAAPARPRTVEAAPLDARGAELASEIARLHRAQSAASAPKSRRDPFRFVTPAPRPVQAPVAVIAPVVPQAPPPPVLKLIGVAEDSAAGRAVRTAIIAGPNQLYIVREGERVTPRYGVTRISPDVVELTDTGDSTPLRLALK